MRANYQRVVGKYLVNVTDLPFQITKTDSFPAINTQTQEKFGVMILHKVESEEPFVLEKEAEFLTKVKSPFLYQFVDMITIQKQIFLFHKLIPDNVQNYSINNQNPMPEALAINIASQLLRALIEINRFGIQYNLINTDSIYIIQQSVKVRNFGMSIFKEFQYWPKLKQNCFNFDLIDISPPDNKTEHLSGIWLMGVVMYKLVTGRNFFVWNRNRPIIPQVTFPAQLNLSQNFKNVVKKCLETNLEQRISWNRLCTHDLFKDLIPQNIIQTDKQIKFNYTMTKLRLNIHKNVINVAKFLSQFPKQLSKQSLLYILQGLGHRLSKQQVINLVDIITVQDTKMLTKKSLTEILQSYGIQTKGNIQDKSVAVNVRKRLAQADENYEQKLKNVIQILLKIKRQRSITEKKIIYQQQFKNILIENQVASMSTIINYYFNFKKAHIMLICRRLCRILQLPLQAQLINKDNHILIERNYYQNPQITVFMMESYIQHCDPDLVYMSYYLLKEPIKEQEEQDEQDEQEQLYESDESKEQEQQEQQEEQDEQDEQDEQEEQEEQEDEDEMDSSE